MEFSLQCSSYALSIYKGDVPLSAFYCSNVGSVKSAQLSKSLLGQPEFETKNLYIFGENLCYHVTD